MGTCVRMFLLGARRWGTRFGEALELRDELLIACRAVLLGVAKRDAAALVAHIDALLDLDDERSPDSQNAADAPGAPNPPPASPEAVTWFHSQVGPALLARLQ